MANEPKTDPSKTRVQTIPLTKIHDLPGVPVMNQPDKSYGGLVSSIQAGGVKEPVILRQREDGEYQLLHGARRRRASELAKQKDIPALVYSFGYVAGWSRDKKLDELKASLNTIQTTAAELIDAVLPLERKPPAKVKAKSKAKRRQPER